jgi:putative tryptophan/tyrosine transport system substrate-binding protein
MGMRLSPILIPFIIGSVAIGFAQGKKSEKRVTIGVVLSASHPNLEANVKGFEKALDEAGLKEGIHLIYDRQNAQGDLSKAESIARRFREGKVGLIHSSATLASRAVVKAIKDSPIVFSCVTDPVAFGLVPNNGSFRGKSHTNVTGVSDRLPVSLQFEMHTQFFPKAKKWGVVYNPEDSKSIRQIEKMRNTAKKLGVELIDGPIFSRAGASQAAESLAQKVHALYVLLDRTSVSVFETVVKVCNERKIPLFSRDIDWVPKGAVASYGIDYFWVGRSAGKMAVRILKGENPGDIPWGPVEPLTLVVNEKAAKTQGVVIPPHLLKKADRVIKEESGTPDPGKEK